MDWWQLRCHIIGNASSLAWALASTGLLLAGSMRLTSLGMASLVVASACDPIAGVYIRQRLAPAPAADCVHAALASSPLTAAVSPLGAPSPPRFQSYRVDLRASTGAGPTRSAQVTLATDSAATSARLSVSVLLRGEMTFTMGSERAKYYAMLASQVADVVRAACAPGAPEKVSCRIEGFGPSRSCTAG